MKARMFIAALTVMACQPLPQQPSLPPERERIEVAISISKDAAIEKTVSAFVAESLTVASSQGGIITSEPIPLKGILGSQVGIITYTATVVGDTESTSRVIVAAYSQSISKPDFMSTQKSVADVRKRPIGSRYGKEWARVERIAARLEQ